MTGFFEVMDQSPEDPISKKEKGITYKDAIKQLHDMNKVYINNDVPWKWKIWENYGYESLTDTLIEYFCPPRL